MRSTTGCAGPARAPATAAQRDWDRSAAAARAREPRPSSGPPAKRQRGVTWGASAPADAAPSRPLARPAVAAGAHRPLEPGAPPLRWAGLSADAPVAAAAAGAGRTNATVAPDIIDGAVAACPTVEQAGAAAGERAKAAASVAASGACLLGASGEAGEGGGALGQPPPRAWGEDTQAAAETLEQLLCAARLPGAPRCPGGLPIQARE